MYSNVAGAKNLLKVHTHASAGWGQSMEEGKSECSPCYVRVEHQGVGVVLQPRSLDADCFTHSFLLLS